LYAIVFYYVFCLLRAVGTPLAEKRYTLLIAMPDVGFGARE
jgi:hypothetical protein